MVSMKTLLIIIGFVKVAMPLTNLFPDNLLNLNLDLLQPLQNQNNPSSLIYTSYQGSAYCSHSFPMKHPQSAAEVQTIVRSAIKNGVTVKAIGSKHSVGDLICTDEIPVSMKGINYALDNGDGTFTFGAGLEVADMLTFLQSKGRSLVQTLTFGGVTVGGALGTGAHGSSLVHPATIADQTVGVTIVDGLGNIQTITDPNELQKFRVNLGLLGIVVDVTLQTVPLFKMTVANVPHSDAILFDGTALSWAYQYDYFQIFWFPSSGETVVTKGNYTDVSTPGKAVTNFIPNLNHLIKGLFSDALEIFHATRLYPGLSIIRKYLQQSLYSKVVGKPPIYSEDGYNLANPATGYGWSLQTNKCKACGWTSDSLLGSIGPDELTFGLNVKDFTASLTMIKDVMSNFPAGFELLGIYLRFIKSSDASMSIANGRTTFVLEYPTFVRKDRFNTARAGLAAYQAIGQILVNRFGGRPHWGKNALAYFSEPVFSSKDLLPNRSSFILAMQKYDPKGIFRNRFGNRLMGTSNLMGTYCVCESNGDCAMGQKCIKFKEARVCKDELPLVAEVLTLPNTIVTEALYNLTSVLNIT